MVRSRARVSVRGNLFHWASFAESQMQRCGDDGELGKGKLYCNMMNWNSFPSLCLVF
jgi:hypothetical protein